MKQNLTIGQLKKILEQYAEYINIAVNIEGVLLGIKEDDVELKIINEDTIEPLLTFDVDFKDAYDMDNYDEDL